jgi:large subunit ribosomal protein L35
MPKMKTHKATKKRFKITGRGKLRRRKQGSSHLRRKKSKRARREMQQGLEVDPVDVKRIERLLGTRVRKKKRKRKQEEAD